MQQMGEIQGGTTPVSTGSSRPLDLQHQVTAGGKSPPSVQGMQLCAKIQQCGPVDWHRKGKVFRNDGISEREKKIHYNPER